MAPKVRRALPDDRDALSLLFAALWPEESAEEHGRELTSLLSGKSPSVMPLLIWIAEAADGRLSDLSKLGFVLALTVVTWRARLDTLKDGTWRKIIGALEWDRHCCAQRKIGRESKVARKWRLTRCWKTFFRRTCIGRRDSLKWIAL